MEKEIFVLALNIFIQGIWHLDTEHQSGSFPHQADQGIMPGFKKAISY